MMLIKNSIIYVSGDLINKAIPFLLLPFLTTSISTEDYGLFSMYGLVISLLTIFIGYGMHSYVSVQYFKSTKTKLRNIINNIIFLLIVGFFIFLLLLFLFEHIAYDNLKIELFWLQMALISGLFLFITNINLMILISENNAKIYTIYQISQSILNFTMIYLLVIELKLGLKGTYIATTSSLIIFGIISIFMLIKKEYLDHRNWINIKNIKSILSFGLPLIPHYLSGWLKTSIDRIFLISFTSASAVGIYAISYQLAMIISILSLAIHKVWSPYILKKLSLHLGIDDKIKIVRYTYLLWMLYALITIFIYFAIIHIFPYVIDARYDKSKELFLYLMIGFLFDGFYYFLSSYILYKNKTIILTYISIISAFVHIAMSYILINMYGIYGSIVSGILSNILLFSLTWIFANKLYPMPWSLRKRE